MTRIEGPEVEVFAGDLDAATATCPAGQSVVSGGFRSIAADGEVFASDTFGATNSWTVLLDNFDSTVDGTVKAVAFCAPSGQAVAPLSTSRSAEDRIAAAIEARRAKR